MLFKQNYGKSNDLNTHPQKKVHSNDYAILLYPIHFIFGESFECLYCKVIGEKMKSKWKKKKWSVDKKRRKEQDEEQEGHTHKKRRKQTNLAMVL